MASGLLAFLVSAHALTSQQSGPSIDLGAGVGIGDRPLAAMFGAQLSLGWWTGTYDDHYAFGRYWWLGGTGRLDARASGARWIPMLEIRRGLELFLAGVSVGAAGGLVASDDPLGWTARAVVQTKLRRTRYLGISLRLEGGIDGTGDRVGFAGSALMGISWARPARAMDDLGATEP